MYRRNESGSTQPAECCVSRLLVDNLVVIGTGFMGASLAAAVKSRGLARQVIGIDPAEAQRAKLLGFIDQVIDRVDRLADSSVAKAGSLAVVIASPVPMFNQILGDLQKSAHRGSLPLQWITDIGSTKRSLISAVENNLTDLAALFVSSHPMAGSEKQGAADADSNLFQGARVLMSRLPRTTDDTFNAVEEFWVALGGQPSAMPIDDHDALLAAISHLPHVVAYSLAGALAQSALSGAAQSMHGAGLRDTTRIAASSPELWADIFLDNRDSLLLSCSQWSLQVAAIESAIRDADRDRLIDLLREASQWRKGFQ